MEILEENIARVEARIYELENPQVSESVGSPILLHQPYALSEAVPILDNSLPADGWWTESEPPAAMQAELIDKFLTFASEIGFFLSPARFRSSALTKPSTLGNYSRPIPALLTAAYLWGILFSGKQSFLRHQGAFLSRALSQIATPLSSSHPQKVVQTIQTHGLLAYYFLSSGRFLEGQYHASVALSLGIGAGLNKIRSRSLENIPNTALGPPLDAVEEGERIDACWTGLFLDKAWAVALAIVPNFTCPTEVQNAQLDTPWPLEQEDYEKRGYPRNMTSSHTLQAFLRGSPASSPDTSTKAFLCKAVMLWERANDLVRTWNTDMGNEDATTFRAAFTGLDIHIENLRKSLPPPAKLQNRTPSKLRALFLAHSLVFSAVLQLHGAFAKTDAQSRQKVMLASKSIMRMVCTVHLGAMTQFINPIMGTIWIPASQFLFEELDNLRAARKPSDEPSREETNIRLLIEDGLRDMQPLERSCTLMKYQLNQIQSAYAEVEGRR